MSAQRVAVQDSHVGWRSNLPTRETIEIFERAFADLQLEGWRTMRTAERWVAVGRSHAQFVSVAGSKGSVLMMHGLEAFMLLARAAALFPEVLHAWRTGDFDRIEHLSARDIAARFPHESRVRVAELAVRAGLESDMYPGGGTLSTESVDKAVDNSTKMRAV